MRTRILEAVSDQGNYGKFLVGVFDHEYEHKDVAGFPFIGPRWGYRPDGHIMVFDLETGEGGLFRPGGMARADLSKHAIWVCPLFEPMLAELYKIWNGNLDDLPERIELGDVPLQLRGYRRDGGVHMSTEEAQYVGEALVDASCAIPQIHPDRGRVLHALNLIDDAVQEAQTTAQGMSRDEQDERLRQRFGELFRARRLALGLSQQEAGERLGVAQNTVSEYENGRVMPSMPVAGKAVKAGLLTADDVGELMSTAAETRTRT